MRFGNAQDEFRIVDARNSEDREYWLSCWDQWPSREVHAHPSYVDLFTEEHQIPIAAIFRVGDSGVLLPMVARPLAAEAWLSNDDSRWDVITPYGYGGPYCWGAPDERAFWQALDSWAQANLVVGLTARLSLFSEGLLPFSGQINTPMMNVVRSLNLSPEDLLSDYASKVRKNVRKARKSGLRVEVDETGERLDSFLAIYYETMKRRGAGEGFYFPKEFFTTIVDKLTGQFVLFHVFQEEKVISTELVLLSANTMYSFLGGTNSEHFPLRPNDLLKHEAIEWGRKQGLQNFVLGGGYGYEDGIYKYKLAFAPSGSVPFKVGYHTFLPSEEPLLVQAREQFAISSDNGWKPRENFFPLYRS